MRRITILAVLAFSCWTASCRNDAVGPDTVEGAYLLQSVRGETVPVIMEDDGTEQQEISSGTLTLNPDSTVVMSTMWTYISDGQRRTLPAVSRGYWSRIGTDSISIVSGTGFFAVGKLSSKKISLKVVSQFEWVFTR